MLSIGDCPSQTNPMHSSSLLRCVVKGCQMLRLRVVPNDKIADSPFVAVHKIGPNQMGKEVVKLNFALRGFHSYDFGRICFIDVNTRFVAEGVFPKNRMFHIRRPFQLLF